MKTYSFLAVVVAMVSPIWGQTEKDDPGGDRVQIALLLDTSNSMDGLIDQTRTQLWKVVNTFIAGNEPFTQGPVDARAACSGARSSNVVVNTIHCGDMAVGVAGSWNDGAALAGGRYVIIDQNRAVPHIDAPQDQEIARLGLKLNETYLGYGKDWLTSAGRQVKADRDAVANATKGAAVERSICKASHNYSNAKWDLVDAVRELNVDPASIPEAELPDEMKKMDGAARIDHVSKAASERAEIQAQIAKLNRERQAFLADARRTGAGTDKQTLDEALVLMVREQAMALGYRFEP